MQQSTYFDLIVDYLLPCLFCWLFPISLTHTNRPGWSLIGTQVVPSLQGLEVTQMFSTRHIKIIYSYIFMKMVISHIYVQEIFTYIHYKMHVLICKN